MRKLISIIQIYALVAAMCSPALASTSTVIKADVAEGLGNGLVNPSFEGSTPARSWTAGTNVTSAVNTTSYVDGKQSLTLSTNVTGVTGAQVLWSQDWTPGAQLSPNNGESNLYVNTTLTTLQVCPRVQGTTLTGQCISVPPTGNWTKLSTNFIFPSSGSVGVALYTTASISASTTIGSIDKGYVGLATNLSQVSQAQMWGTLTTTGQASCNWATSSSSYADFSAQASCPSPTATGNLTAPGTLVPWAVANNAPPGTYEVTAQFGLFNSATQEVGCRIIDESSNVLGQVNVSRITGDDNPIHLTGVWTYTTPGSHTWKVQCLAGSSVSININNNSSAYNFAIIAKFFPSQSQTALRPDATPASWSGYHTGVWTMTTSGTANTFGDFTSGTSPVLTARGTPRNISCVTSANAAIPGITCALPRSGNYKVCSGGIAINSTSTQGVELQITDGSNVVLNNGIFLSPTGTGNGIAFPMSCGQYTAASAGSYTFKLRGASNGTSQAIQIGASGIASDSLDWTIDEQDAPMSAPYLMGSVTSNTSGQLRTEYADINLNGTSCSVNTQSGSWITGASRPSARRCTITVASGIFSSSNYVCTCSPSTAATSLGACWIDPVNVTKTATQFQIITDTNLLDNPFSIICQGPR